MEVRRADGRVIAVEVVGEPDAPAVLFCHGLADSRLAVYDFAGAAHALGLRLIAPDRPGIGGTEGRRLPRVVRTRPDSAPTRWTGQAVGLVRWPWCGRGRWRCR
ncbi:hypothetical protein [Streptomyces sp. NPDC002205]|uniref:alpha/beta fold hydrolase n=1 Tax=Streptomyces sp. NPDC002205 TaxID=3154411 RepID=UPI00332B6F0B